MIGVRGRSGARNPGSGPPLVFRTNNVCSKRRAIGQMLIMGWDGTEVTPQIRNLIEEHHLGTILLTAKNLRCESATYRSSTSLRQGHVTTKS